MKKLPEVGPSPSQVAHVKAFAPLCVEALNFVLPHIGAVFISRIYFSQILFGPISFWFPGVRGRAAVQIVFLFLCALPSVWMPTCFPPLECVPLYSDHLRQ